MGRANVHIHLDHLPDADGQSYLYAALFAGGMVKIGATRCPRPRLVGLQQQRGEKIVQAAAVALPFGGGDMYSFEAKALKRARGIASAVVGREFFAGLSFDDAVQALAAVATPEPATEGQGA